VKELEEVKKAVEVCGSQILASTSHTDSTLYRVLRPTESPQKLEMRLRGVN
jgi:hypothetical protein